MFRHSGNNPKNTIITNDCYTVSFGHRCTSALACKYSNMRNFSLPFDWCSPAFPKKIQNVLENNFEDFIPDAHNGILHNKYEISFPHFNSNINDGIEEYKRRIERFNYIMNDPKKKYFIYINEDYLYNSDYRGDEFNDRIFNEMLELEKFIKNKYINIDYNILYFNFKHHNIPEDSNIINIVLHTDNLYDNHDSSPFEDLRHYCGDLLALLFHTQSIYGYDENTFHN